MKSTIRNICTVTPNTTTHNNLTASKSATKLQYVSYLLFFSFLLFSASMHTLKQSTNSLIKVSETCALSLHLSILPSLLAKNDKDIINFFLYLCRRALTFLHKFKYTNKKITSKL